MVFDFPYYLLTLLVLVPVVIILFVNFRRGLRGLESLSGKFRYSKIRNVYTVKNFLSGLFFTLFIIAMVFALGGIKWGEKIVQDKRTGYEIVLLMDDSKSMLVHDIEPSRLKKSVLIAKGVIDEIKNGMFGLVLFKGDAVENIPITDDPGSLKDTLDKIKTDWISSPGTNIERGLMKAYNGFSGNNDSNRVIILFSDGEEQTGDSVKYAKFLGKKAVPVICVALGTQKGGIIRLADGRTVKNNRGDNVVSQINRSLLENIARASGGVYIDVEHSADILEKIKNEIEKVKLGDYGSGFRVVKRYRYGLLLIFAVFFLSLSVIIWKVPWQNTV
ncbi:MAG: VWA domain-containing protein [Spirochaetales bacterium]|nr:VWA domain-containing protein [Spirochaetales bacterium]